MNLLEQILNEFVNQRAATPGDDGYRNPNFYSIKPDGKLQYYPQGPTSKSRQQNLSTSGHRQANIQDIQAWEDWFDPNKERPKGIRTWADYLEYLESGGTISGAGGSNKLGQGGIGDPLGEPGEPGDGGEPGSTGGVQVGPDGEPIPDGGNAPPPDPRNVKFNKELDPEFNKLQFKRGQNLARDPSTVNGRKLVPHPISDNLSAYMDNMPEYYGRVLRDLLNTKKGSKAQITDFIAAAGAGTLSSTSGEILCMTFMNLDDDESAALLRDKLLEFSKLNKNSSILDRSWVVAAYNSRIALKRYLDDRYGTGKWRVEAVAWDVQDEVENIGLDYDEKGFSTDAFIRLDVGGSPELVEISLKKDKNVNLLNSSTARIREILFLERAPDHIQEERDSLIEERRSLKSSKKDLDRKLEIDKRLEEIELQYTSDIPDTVDDQKTKERQYKIHDLSLNSYTEELKEVAKQIVTRNPEIIEQIDKKMGAGGRVAREINRGVYDEVLARFVKHGGPMSMDQLIEYSRISGLGGSTRKSQKVGMILATGAFVTDETSEASNYFLNLRKNAYGHTKEVRDYIFKNPDVKAGMMRAIGADFPIKSILEGEETMIIGNVSLDKLTAQDIFKTTIYDELEENLRPVDYPPPPHIVYEIEGQEPIPVALLNTRPDGVGYGDTWKFEMGLHPEFYDRIVEANKNRNRIVDEPVEESLKNFIHEIIEEFLEEL